MMVVGPREEPGLALVDPWGPSPRRDGGHHEERAMAVVTVAPPLRCLHQATLRSVAGAGRNLAGSSSGARFSRHRAQPVPRDLNT